MMLRTPQTALQRLQLRFFANVPKSLLCNNIHCLAVQLSTQAPRAQRACRYPAGFYLQSRLCQGPNHPPTCPPATDDTQAVGEVTTNGVCWATCERTSRLTPASFDPITLPAARPRDVLPNITDTYSFMESLVDLAPTCGGSTGQYICVTKDSRTHAMSANAYRQL